MKKVKLLTLTLLVSTQLFGQTDLNSLHEKLIKFYGYQRAGLKSGSCANQNSGFANASHNGDKYNDSYPLDGGWYDAGDYIKFGMNLGYTVYSLLKGYDVFPSGYGNKYAWNYSGTDAIPDILNEVKFATDYIMKAIVNENTIVLDVGIASDEHTTWGVKYGSGRSGNQIKLCTGADIPATYAACLALMSIVYRKYDATYADQCLAKAKVAFAFAKKKIDAGETPGNLYCDPQLKAGSPLYYYPKNPQNNQITRQIADRMVAAGVELYRATDNADPIYRKWAQKSIVDFSNCIGYPYIGPIAAFEVWRQGLGGDGALSMNLGFIDSKIQKTGTFAGVYKNSGWGTARDIGSAAFEYALGYVTEPNETKRKEYEAKVKSHINWLTGGSGGQSYITMVNNGPKKIHYRTTNYGLIPGAVVSGPNDNGYDPNSTSADYNEVAIDYNAGAIGAVAFLKALSDPGEAVKISSAFKASPANNIDFTKNSSVTFSATFSKSVKWTITINGLYGSKSYTGTGTSISQAWDGSADKGQFLSNETVSARLSVEENVVAYDLVKVTALNIFISRANKPGARSNDKLFDDFNDNNLTNNFSGKWSAFGTGTGLAATTAKLVTDSGSFALTMRGNVRTNDQKNWAGVKTTFNSEGTPVNIGQVKSVIFDLRADKAVDVYVEFQQSGITDGGVYHRAMVPVTITQNRYRIDIKEFKQPEGTSNPVALNFSSITALRFTVYDSIYVNTYLDNVAIEGLELTPVAVIFNPALSTYKQCISKNTLLYTIPQRTAGTFTITLFDIAGKTVLTRSFSNCAGKEISLSFAQLPPGMYSIVNNLNGKPFGQNMTIIHTKQ